MADLRREGRNNQRRSVDVLVSEGFIPSAESELFNLPNDCVITGVGIVVESGESGATVDVKFNGSVIADELSAGTSGSAAINAVNVGALSGGVITAGPGSTAPTTAVVKIMIEFIELNKVTGEYTP